MNRKGAASYLIKVIMAALLILIVAGLVWKVSISVTGFGLEQECKSVITTGGLFQILNPNAPIKATKPSQQFNTDISICPINSITYKQRTDHELIKEDIANEMISCYQKYGRGEVNLFEQNPGRNIYCVMCTYIEFENDVGRIEGLMEYMNEKEMKGFDVTYAEFLAGASSTRSASGIELDTQNQIILETDKDYAVYFVYGKVRDFWSDSLGNNIKTGVAGTVGGTAVGIGIVALAPVSAPIAVIIAPLAIVGGIAGFFSGPDAVPDEFTGMVMISEYNAEIVRQLGCTDIGARTS